MTRHLVWQEYKEKYPDGYGYSRFCFNLEQLLKARKPGSILEHHPDEKLFVDFANHYGFAIPTRVRKPRDKAAFAEKAREHNQTRMQQKTGATGCGKSFIASAPGDRACRQDFSVMYFECKSSCPNSRL